MLKIKVNRIDNVKQVIHFKESDIISISEEDGLTTIVLVDRSLSSISNGAIHLYTREPIELSEYSSLVEVKEKTIVEHRNEAGFVGSRQYSEAVIDKENKELRFRLTDVIDELKQRLDKLENK